MYKERIFYNDEILNEYEQKQQWEQSVLYLKEKVHLKPYDKSILYRLAAQCWYILTFWDSIMPKERMDKEIFEFYLKDAYCIAREKWWSDGDCLWLFGYFMCVNQFVFWNVCDDISDIEQEGERLISKSYADNPGNLPAKVLYLADHGKKFKYIKAKKRMQREIKKYFLNQSEVEVYFGDIFMSLL